MNLLQSKLCIPPMRREHIDRPRLVALLDAGLQAKLTLVSAPAGFGKTTLLGEWLRGLDRPYAWVSLDSDDNAWPRFLACILTSLQRIDPAFGAGLLGALESPQTPPFDHFQEALPRALATLDRPFLLVLEDFHVIVEPRVHQLLTYLLDNLPPRMHLILAGRSDPPWPLARLRASGALNEIRVADLRFTLDEAAALLNDVLGLRLSQADLTSLDERTEGWVTGLRLAALSLNATRDRAGFIRAFAGSDRFVLDYLMEEVLAQQPAEVAEFLRQTSLLDRFNAQIADHLTGRTDSQTMLRRLESANLFVEPLDNERLWFAYHSLMRTFLRAIQKARDPAETAGLHLKASQWFEANGDVLDAIQHALAAEAYERVGGLIRSNGLALVFQGELATVLNWFHDPQEVRPRTGPWPQIAHLWAHSFSGDDTSVGDEVTEAQAAVSEGVQAFEDDPDPSRAAELRHALAHLTAIQANLAVMDGRHAEAARLVRQALAGLPAGDTTTRRYSYVCLGMALRHTGDLPAACEALALADAPPAPFELVPAPARGLATLAGIHIWMGRLDEAEASARRLVELHDEHLRRCGRRLPIAAFGYARLSEVLLQRNQLPQALAAAQESRALAEPWQQMDALFESYTHLARAFHAGGDAASALALLHRLEYLIRDRSLWLTSMTQMEQARLYLASPQDPSGIERAYSWAAAHPLPAEGKLVFRDHALYLTHTLLMLHEAATDRQSAYNGRGLIDRLLPLLEASGAFGLALQASVLGALLDAALGEVDSALGRLLMCLRRAEPQGYVRLFVDHGAPMYSLLARVPATEPTYAYARELLGALASPSPPTVSPARPAQASLVEPLSDRELDVLRLLATALSAAEIADELCVATSTVRSHTKAIYGKLGVHTRLEAIDAARGLGLIPSL